ncbi:soluble scavenger receptor cysteine-rich domain-containing protein SSC5D-like [Halichondria panicea]|uniref:soluble scavenger receptor cysteine-rich domain-containing protein SSC5D-like n=1 Tax=Halichondria panicea TaxID=6063 RepID=UPI00312B7F62
MNADMPKWRSEAGRQVRPNRRLLWQTGDNGQWGTVCDDLFSPNDAVVACRQLGFSNYTRYGTVGRLGFSEASSFTRTWLDNLGCRGTESRLVNCPAHPIGVEDCTHSEDVALFCAASTASPNGDLRLVSNSGRTGGSSGRLEFYYSRQWGTVCDDLFSPDDAVVACRQLGFSNYTQYGTVGRLGFSEASSFTQTWLDKLRCRGTESRLINCPANTIGVEDCTHSEDVALSCAASTASPNGDLRLVDRSGRTGGSSGRLEVYYNGQWGTVCNDSFGVNDARVACCQLGFSTYTRYGNVETLGFFQASSSTRTWLDELRCRGSESRLINCPANTIGVEDCSHSQDVALVCTGSTTSAQVWIFLGVVLGTITTAFIIISATVIFNFLRRRLHPPPTRNPLDHTTSTHNKAYSMNQRSSNSNQAPPQNVHGAQPTGQYASSLYRTSYPQQPPAPYSLGELPSAPYSTEEPPSALYPTEEPPSAPYSTEEPPSALYPTEEPPSAQYPTEEPPPALYFSGGEAAPSPYPG